MTVTVANVNEPPIITTTSRTAFSQPENRTSTLYTFRATDPEGGTVTWLAAGPDGGLFTIDEGAGSPSRKRIRRTLTTPAMLERTTFTM